MKRPTLGIVIPVLLACPVLLASCSGDDSTAPPVPEPPMILGQDVAGIDHQSATLGGWVDGHGRPTVCWFDYGNDIAYGARTPDIDAGAAAGPVRVEHELTWLDPDKTHWWRLVAVAGGDTVFAADSTFVTLPVPNEPPMTQVTHAPLGDNRFHMYWTGNDPDGVVVGFRWRLSDNGLDGTIDVPDTLGLPWHFTTATDSIFVVPADQAGGRADPDDGGPALLVQVHTFWIKAVDNRGADDPTPAYITFTAVAGTPGMGVAVPPE